jgi:ribosomal protein S18 acetylase RimI-like enzyme
MKDERLPAEIHVVDIVISPGHRGRGIGTRLMTGLMSEAQRAQRPVRLQVLKNTRAVGFYHRLGFFRISETDFYEQMEWRDQTRGG